MSQAPLFFVGGTSLFLRGLNSFLQDADFAAVAEFENAETCVRESDASPTPEIIIYISTGESDESQAAVDTLMGAYPDVGLMVLSGELSVDELGACLKVGARGYLLSSISKDALIHSLTLIRLGETVFPSGLASAWVNGGLTRRRVSGAATAHNLTPRETEIVGCLTDGASNKHIARQLGITEATVKIHMKSLIRKIGVTNRTQAALWAIEAGFGQDPSRIAA